MLQVLNRQIARLAHLVDELLDVSRLHTGPLMLACEPLDLVSLTREVVERMNAQHLEQVLLNLLSNAMKYGRHRPIHVSVRRQDTSALIIVRDHGIGIAEKDQVRIFNRFERAVSVRNFGGFGLGLYLVRWIVTAHGGSVRVKSKPNAGATFIVELPLRSPAVDE